MVVGATTETIAIFIDDRFVCVGELFELETGDATLRIAISIGVEVGQLPGARLTLKDEQ